MRQYALARAVTRTHPLPSKRGADVNVTAEAILEKHRDMLAGKKPSV